MMDLFLPNMQRFTSQDVNWLLVDYCDVFISCLDSHSDWHPFTADDPLVSKWWNATFLQICSDEETNKLIYILDDLRASKFPANIHFWINYSFK